MHRIINVHVVNDGAWFEAVICLLKSRYRLISAESLHEFYLGRTDMKNFCHITADDGDKSFYDVVLPVLKKHNVPASIYVSPKICEDECNYWFQEVVGYNQVELIRIIAGVLDLQLDLLRKYSCDSILKTLPIHQIHKIIETYQRTTHTARKPFKNLTVNNLKELNRSGLVTIGAHTISHPILKNEDDVNSKYEIDESLGELSVLLKHKINYFAYPNGIPRLDFTEREEAYLIDAGVRLAFTTKATSISSIDNLMRVPRIPISNGESMSFLKTKLALTPFWNTFKRLKPTGEYRERKEVGRIISAANALRT